MLILGIAITTGFVLVVIGAGAAFYALKSPARDEKTGCVVGAVPPSITTILIDASDALTPRQEADIRGNLNDIQKNIPTDGRVEIYALTGKADALLTAITVACNPGDPSKVNQLVSSQTIAQDQWHAIFAQPFDQAINKSLRDNPSKLSPILEAIQSVAIQSLARDEYRNSKRKLIVVSDFIQNTTELDQYKEKTSFDKFSATPYYRRVRSDLRDVAVDLLYVWRNTKGSVQGRTHAEFWSELLADEGAKPIDVKSIQG